MNAMQEKLFQELRQTKTEIERSLKNKQTENWFTTILEEEMADIDLALKKIEEGNFGHCELSGELLPLDLLNLIPTIRTVNDPSLLGGYCKKPIFPTL
ncbi:MULTISPECIES: hypothetical protein [Neobacillus]|uniref:DksA C4-type domain-containing protein n=1 Tax=Neobacillus citreus TaxID=2833578 RepID=A0A942SW72_9BACI|nr:hypothetical protein [Neobacillus citreus]MCH6268360.1 hypothetical protein [Neobacillus citreus]